MFISTMLVFNSDQIERSLPEHFPPNSSSQEAKGSFSTEYTGLIDHGWLCNNFRNGNHSCDCISWELITLYTSQQQIHWLFPETSWETSCQVISDLAPICKKATFNFWFFCFCASLIFNWRCFSSCPIWHSSDIASGAFFPWVEIRSHDFHPACTLLNL